MSENKKISESNTSQNKEQRKLIIKCNKKWSFVANKKKQWIWFAIDQKNKRIVGVCTHSRYKKGAKGLWASLPEVYRQDRVCYKNFWDSCKKLKTGDAVEKKSKKPRYLLKFVKWTVIMFFTVILLSGAGSIAVYFYLSKALPKISSLNDYRPSVITKVYSDDNRKIGEFYRERREIIPLHEMPSILINAFIAAEDARFFNHKGIDVYSIIRAFFRNLKAGTIVQGGSTITQQVTRSFFLTPEKKYIRKIKEAILAYRIEKQFTKKEILFLYLNQIYLGHGAYGVQAASENYFGKSVKELNLAECAMLAGLPQAPSRYSPFRFPKRAEQRQRYVLNRMVTDLHISRAEATKAMNTKLDIKSRRNWYIEKVPIYTEHVRREVEKKYGTEVLYTGGLKIYTAVNIEIQKMARAEVEKGLNELDKRQGYRGPLEHLKPEEIEAFSKTLDADSEKPPMAPGNTVTGVVISLNKREQRVDVRMGKDLGTMSLPDMEWANKPDLDSDYYKRKVTSVEQVLKVGDVILVKLKGKKHNSDIWELSLEQIPRVQAAFLCLESGTGHLKAMIGGRDFRESQFNRAVQSRRQPGSAFKPIIYAAAIDKGYTPATKIIDSPEVYTDVERDFKWKPKNYEKKFYGPILLRPALAKSRNVVTIKILKDIGINYAISYARKLGVTSHLSKNLSIALGSSGLSLLEIVKAYSVFVNQGDLVEPVFITKIVDRDGNILEETKPSVKQVIDPSTAYIMTSLLESVVQDGTGWRMKKLNRPVAGKTGTTNNLHDAWFIGFTPRYVTGTWVGFDEESSLGKGETGSRAAGPIWLGFMQQVLKNKPVKVFKIPQGVVFSRIDAETGLLPIAESNKIISDECFKEGTAPTEYTKRPDSNVDQEDFYKSIM
jgi:penicillin-binding protein 1A